MLSRDRPRGERSVDEDHRPQGSAQAHPAPRPVLIDATRGGDPFGRVLRPDHRPRRRAVERGALPAHRRLDLRGYAAQGHDRFLIGHHRRIEGHELVDHRPHPFHERVHPTPRTNRGTSEAERTARRSTTASPVESRECEHEHVYVPGAERSNAPRDTPGRRRAVVAARFCESPFIDISPTGSDGFFFAEQVDEMIAVLDRVRRNAAA